MPLMALGYKFTWRVIIRFFRGWFHGGCGQTHCVLSFELHRFFYSCLSKSEHYIFDHAVDQFNAITVNLIKYILLWSFSMVTFKYRL